jgi:glycosyltransferase involved in cell wall biosynthesis
VPCYNEADRLNIEAFRSFIARTPGVDFVFVNDGSTDQTAAVLRDFAASAPDRVTVISCERNQGKAEAVRVGMLHALSGHARYAGFWDADLATPLVEIPRFVEIFEGRPACEICFGARVQLLGRTIRRRAYRHYIGRAFASAASLALQLPVYDTQCGAKLFRVSAEVLALFAEPFVGRWTFDVEIIARLARQRSADLGRGPLEVIYELPLNEWRDAEGSKVSALDFMKALIELARIRRKYYGAAERQRREEARSRGAALTTRVL